MRPTLSGVVRRWWCEVQPQEGLWRTGWRFARALWEFLRESTPSRRRQRYGDVDYDWDYRVDTTGATVGWRDRLIGMFLSSYEPTEPTAFREMLSSLQIPFEQFTFVDLGCGKGRTLLMASDFPFRRVVGVEILSELYRIAQQNIARYKAGSQTCFHVECVCADAREFPFPPEPIVVYLFNPLPEPGLAQVLSNLEASLANCPRQAYIVYHNPLLEHVLAGSKTLRKLRGNDQYALYGNT